MIARLRSGGPCWCGSGRRYGRCHERRLVRPGRVSPRRSVPAAIGSPDYAGTGVPVDWPESPVKSTDMIARLRRAGAIAAEVLEDGLSAVCPRVTTDALDRVVHEACLARGAYPSPLNYKGFPKSVCTSVNEVICHGIPDDRVLLEGDLINLDVTVFYDGVHADTSATVAVGSLDSPSSRLIACAQESLEVGIGAVRAGQPISAIGDAIERHAATAGYGVVREYGGHGIGAQFHTDPWIPHFAGSANMTRIEPGMVFTVEPMLTMGSPKIRQCADGWAVVAADGGRSAQFEHTVLVGDRAAEVLTARPRVG